MTTHRSLRRSPLVAFFVLAYALSWAWTVPQAISGVVVHRGNGWPTQYPALVGPAVAAVAVTAWSAGRPGLRELAGRVLRWRVPVRWWLVAVSPVGFLGLGLLLTAAAGKSLPAAADFGRFSGTPAIGVLGVFLVVCFVGALGEEIGWRGYALPRLQRRRSPLVATLVLAPLWFAWHLPQFRVIGTYRDFAPGEYVGMFLGLSCGAVVLTWLYNRTGSVLLVTVWHGVYNMVGATQAASGVLAAVISTLVMVQGGALVVLEVRARRRGRASVLGPPEDDQSRSGSVLSARSRSTPISRAAVRSRVS